MSDSTFTRRRPRSFDGSSTAERAVFAATEELLGESRLQDLTVEQIISAAGVSRANFYHYFANKFDVLVSMLGNLLEQSYSENPPWASQPGRARAKSMGASLESTLSMWSDHGAVVCAAIEHMHTHAAVAAAWERMFTRFVEAVAEQIEFERSDGRAHPGARADLVAAMLVGAAERTFYVSSRELDPRLPTVADVVAPLRAITEATIYGPPQRTEAVSKTGAATTGASDSGASIAPVSMDVPELEGDTATAILDAMKELLVERPLSKLSVAAVLKHAGVSRASFYFYYRSIESAFVVLFRQAAAEIVSGMGVLATTGGEDRESISAQVHQWLALSGYAGPVIRNAVHAWPSLPELRIAYLEAMSAMQNTVEAIINTRRALGYLTPGPPAAPYAAAAVWAIERAVAGALAGETHLDDLESVTGMVGDFMAEVVFGITAPSQES